MHVCLWQQSLTTLGGQKNTSKTKKIIITFFKEERLDSKL